MEEVKLKPQLLGSQQALPRQGASSTGILDTQGLKPLHPLPVLSKAQCQTLALPAWNIWKKQPLEPLGCVILGSLRSVLCKIGGAKKSHPTRTGSFL